MSTNLGTALRPLLERSIDAALVLRPDGLVTYANPAVRQVFGWSDEEIIDSAVTTVLHPDDRSAPGGFLEPVPAAPGAHPPVELRVRRGQDWVWAEAALTNRLDDPTVRGVCNLRVSLRRATHEEVETRARQLETTLQTRVVLDRPRGFSPAAAGSPRRRHSSCCVGVPGAII